MPLPQAEYEAQLNALIQSQDYQGAAALQCQQGIGHSEGAAAGSGEDFDHGDDDDDEDDIRVNEELLDEDDSVSEEGCTN